MGFLLTEGFAQSRAEQIMSVPSLDKRSTFDGKKFYAGRTGNQFSKKAPVKSFYYVNKTRTKEFRTGTFFGSKKKNSNAGRVFQTQEANTTGDHQVPGIERQVDKKTYRTRNAPEADRSAPTREYPFLRQADVRGKSQKALDQQYNHRPALTVEEVRKILNRSK